MSQVWHPTPSKPTEARPFMGELHPLDAADLAYFLQRFELTAPSAYQSILVSRSSGRYAMPIVGPDGHIRGHVLRKPWAGAPRACPFTGPKADTYKAVANEPLQSHYWADIPSQQLIVVEDQLSAIKLAAYGYDSVALLGVPDCRHSGYSGSDRIAEIARRAKGMPVIVALDSDMTETAFLFAKKWRHAFSSIRVAMLAQDLKDTLAADFAEVLGT